MTRRQTSVIAEPGSPVRSLNAAQANEFNSWAWAAARELCLDTQGDENLERAAYELARARWQLARGGNPSDPHHNASGRSTLTRVNDARADTPFWRKVFAPQHMVLQLNEINVLTYLGADHTGLGTALRKRVAFLRTLSSQGHTATRAPRSTLNQIETHDAGPDLDDWRAFAPCVVEGKHGLPVPLFMHPTFLAALTRQALMALELFCHYQVVHNDIKPNNVCFALPKNMRFEGGAITAQCDLLTLPLCLIDFELSYVPSTLRLALPLTQNPWVSPFAKAVHQHALAAQQGGNNRAARDHLDAIDWGADLWSLGHMLGDWVTTAQAYGKAFCAATSTTFGSGSAPYKTTIQTLTQLGQGLAELQSFARALQSHDRPLATATALTHEARTVVPLGSLRSELEALFIHALHPSLRSNDWQVFWHDPSSPLAHFDRGAKTFEQLLAVPQFKQAEAARTSEPEPQAAPLPRPAPSVAAAPEKRVITLTKKILTLKPASPPPPPPARRPAFPADLTELTVPGEGARCPSFIVIPYLGPVALGTGSNAIQAHTRHRFAMGTTPVTVWQWQEFWAAGDRDYEPSKFLRSDWDWQKWANPGSLPVVGVNVADAEAYARWFQKRHGQQLGVRVESLGLPSELEWELAARGGRLTQEFLWDRDDDIDDFAVVERMETAPVRSKKPNGYGLYDVIGNVWEWTDSPHRKHRRAIPAHGHDSAGVSAARAVCGASFNYSLDWLGLAQRHGVAPGVRDSVIGFRLVARIAP